VEIDRVGPGEFVGEGGFVQGRPRNATCRAVTPCAVYELKRRDLDTIKASCPALLAALAQAVEDRPVDFCPLESQPQQP